MESTWSLPSASGRPGDISGGERRRSQCHGSSDPTTPQRMIKSTVALQSGAPVVPGGLIRENEFSSGIPALCKLTLVGLLVGQESGDGRRTGLVVLIAPRSVKGAAEARQITEGFRDKIESLKQASVKNGNDGGEPSASSTVQ